MTAAAWIRFEHRGRTGFGRLEGDAVQVHEGDLFASPAPTGEVLPLAGLRLLTPTAPSKMPALWNNYRALAAEKGLVAPDTPLYLLKANSSFLATGETIRHPPGLAEDVFYEGELGIVVGRTPERADPATAAACIFGYTCVNDVTAFSLLKDYPGFDQWTRAKGFDTFGVFGPAVATGLDWRELRIVTRVDGEERQNYPASDMILPPAEIVAALAAAMTLLPGDVICCGTSQGLGPMPRGCTVEVAIDGIGVLSNPYR